MQTSGSLILTCVTEYLFLLNQFCSELVLQIDSERNDNVRMDNNFFLNFEIYF